MFKNKTNKNMQQTVLEAHNTFLNAWKSVLKNKIHETLFFSNTFVSKRNISNNF